MKIFSTAFSDGDTIPRQYTGDGDDISPPLAWSNPPVGSKEYAIMCLDPDAPSGKDRPFVHWVAYGIPNTASSLPEEIPMRGELAEPVRFSQGKNSFGKIGYNGPLPPKGASPHHYVFKLYALDKKLNLPAEEDKDSVLKAISQHVIATNELTVLYQR